ncbi:hypothetical protein AwDysgo_06730 [Bacteroidales bacterium]|nr:hypothetical protein AwDysgo_06730 [Bacteroidales bacterium]
MKKYLFLLIAILFLSCANNEDIEIGDGSQIPTHPGGSEGKTDMPVQMWIDAHANLSRFETKENITSYLEKMKTTGFNEIYLDVKPGIGYALYESHILKKLNKWGQEVVVRDWDYLGYWIQEAERFDISVIASISALGYGSTTGKEGAIYDDDRWLGKTQIEMLDNDPNKLVDMRDQTGVDAVMLNPSLPEVQAFVISIVEEIVTKYPKLKGVCLDYCRWYGGKYGFGDATILEFESYSGIKVNNRNEIITSTGGIGPLYSKWIEFRTMTITNLVTNIRSKVKSIDPAMELHFWASADWASRYGVGQNWGSKKYIPKSSGIYTDTYSKTGFADQIDVFSLGAYADAVWASENPGSVWSVENFVKTYSTFTMGDCKVYGSIPSYAYKTNAKVVSDAVYLCLKNTDGLMVFEISHVINNNQWDAIKEGIERVVKK